MSGYPQPPPGYGYGQPYAASPYGSPPPPQQQQPHHQQQPQYSSSPYAAPSAPYAPNKPPKESHQSYGSGPAGYPQSAPGYGKPEGHQSYGSGPAGYPQSAPGYGKPEGHQSYGSGPTGYPPSAPGHGNPFAALVPSAFPPGTDPSVVACFQMADQDGSGLIDDKELQSALSSYNQGFSLRTVHLLMYNFTNSNIRKIGPKEFTALFYGLQNWRTIFERFDRDRSGKIETNELREALLSLGYAVSPVVLDLLVSKFDKSGGKSKAIEYDNFIECCLTVKGLTEKFKEKDTTLSGSATFTYESFMLTVLPFLIA